MARAPTIAEYIPADAEDDLLDRPADTASSQLEDELRDSLKDADETAEVALYRQKTANHKDGMAICESWSADVATWALIQREARKYVIDPYNDTYFRALIRKRGKIVEHKPFSLAARARDVVAVAKGDGGIADVLNTMVALQRESQAETRAMIERLATQRVADGDAEEKILDKMAKYKALFGGAPAGPTTDAITSLVTTLAGLAKLKGLAGDLGFLPGEAREIADPTDVMAVLGKLAPQALGLFQRQQEIRAAELNAAVLSQHGGPAAPANQSAPVAVRLSPAGHALTDPQRKVMEALHAMAVQDADIEEPADWLVSQPEIRAFLAPMVGVEKPFPLLLSIWSAAAEHPEWWLDLISAIRARLTAAPAGGDTPAKSVPTGGSNDVSSGSDDPGLDSGR